MSYMHPRYRLLKDLLGIKAGRVYVWNATEEVYEAEGSLEENWYGPEKLIGLLVECNPDWFEPLPLTDAEVSARDAI